MRNFNSSANDMELKQRMKQWPIHAKLIGRIDLDAISSLDGPTTSAESWQHELQWLRNDERYHDVPILDDKKMNDAKDKMKNSWITRLLECGVIAPIDPPKIRGHVLMFAIPEVAKQRFRSIKYTKDINTFCGRDT